MAGIIVTGFFSRLKQGLSKTTLKITDAFNNILTKSKLDDEALEQIEEILLMSDMGHIVATQVTESLRKNRYNKDINENELRQLLSEELQKITVKCEGEVKFSQQKPTVIVMCGVNGNGKTTSIGKLSNTYQKLGKTVAMAACDTFRVAAIEQLEIWAQRNNCDFYKGAANTDPASVAYNAYKQAKEKQTDILFIDTAGRLQNKTNLMEELRKIIKVLGKIDSAAPHEIILTIDATTGQNAISQFEEFSKIVPVSGIIVTKLDGTAKGGIIVQIAASRNIPIYYVGVGESLEDMDKFSAKDYCNNLTGAK